MIHILHGAQLDDPEPGLEAGAQGARSKLDDILGLVDRPQTVIRDEEECPPAVARRSGDAGNRRDEPTGLAQAVERYTARGVRVAIEAGNQTAWIVDLLRELGAKVNINDQNIYYNIHYGTSENKDERVPFMRPAP